jgi:outer membrane biosynthesis protein TonB
VVAAAQWDPADIEAVVAREQRRLAPCLRQEAARSTGFRGEIPIEFAIGNDGRVEKLWIDEPRFKAGPLHACLLEALRAWRFKPFPGQRPVVSLAFRVGGS